jgi:ketosteroid isomerase-like protein
VTEADVVAALFDAFARRDAEAALPYVHPEAEFWPRGTNEMRGRDEPYRGPDGVREYLADVDRLWDELVVEPGELRSVAGGVVAFGTARGRIAGEPVEMPVVWLFRVREGMVVFGRASPTVPPR